MTVKGTQSSPVHHLIGGVLIKGIVKSERLVFQVASEVHFLLGLVHHDHVFTWDGDDVQFLR